MQPSPLNRLRRSRLIITPLFVAVIVLLATAFIAVYHLQRESLWFDEAWTVWAIHDNPANQDGELKTHLSLRENLSAMRDDFVSVFNHVRQDDVHPPLYYLLLNVWVMVGGESEFMLRLYSLFWGLLAIAGLMRLGRQMVDWRVGVYGAVLLGTSGFFLYYTREARMYTQFLALCVLSSLALWRWLAHRSWRRGLGYGVTLGMLLLTHYVGALVVGVQVLAVTVWGVRHVNRTHWRFWWTLAMPYAVGFLVFLPWLPFALFQFRERGQPAALPLPTDWGSVAALVYQLTTAQTNIFGVCLLLGLPALRHPKVRLALGYVLAWGVVPLALLLAINTRIPIFQLRYVIFVWGAGALLLALALRYVEEWWQVLPIPSRLSPYRRNLKKIAPWVGVGLLAMLAVVQLVDAQWLPKSDWRTGVRLASEARTADQPALVSYLDSSPVAYYDRRYGLRKGISLDVGWQAFSPQTVRDITQKLQNNPSIWVIMQASDPPTWDVLATLLAVAPDQPAYGIGYRYSVNGMLFYRLDAGKRDPLGLTFEARDSGKIYPYHGQLGQVYRAKRGESVCVDTGFDADDAYHIGVYLMQGYNTVLAQADAPLAPQICMTLPDVPSAEYHLRLQVFNPVTQARALLVEGGQYWGDFIGVGTVQIN